MADSLWTEDGVPRVYSSPRPLDTRTYFSSCGDTAAGLGEGPELIFNMLVVDTYKEITISYNELVYIKDGYLIYQSAPLGAKLTVAVLAPNDEVVAHFCKNVFFFGHGFIPLDTEDRGELPAGFKLKVIIYNSNGLAGRDPAAAFQVVGRLEMYRAITV